MSWTGWYGIEYQEGQAKNYEIVEAMKSFDSTGIEDTDCLIDPHSSRAGYIPEPIFLSRIDIILLRDNGAL